MDRGIVWPSICAALFVAAAALFLIDGARRRRLDALLLSAAPPSSPQTSTPKQLGLFTHWTPRRRGDSAPAPGSAAALALAAPERRWTYDRDYMIAFVAALEHGSSLPTQPGLRYYAGPILRLDIWFAAFFAAFIACTGFVAAGRLGQCPFLARAAVLAACLGLVYGVADIAEDVKLRSILLHAEQVAGAPKPPAGPKSKAEAAARLEVADAAEVDAANALTRLKLIMLAASGIGLAGFALLWLADRLVGAVSGGHGGGATAARPQPVRRRGAPPV